MQLKHGQYIDAKMVEALTRHWSGFEFENLCNALVWTYAPGARLSSKDYTPDGGIDAEFILDKSRNDSFIPVVKCGRNVFQYKKRADRLDPKIIEGEFERFNSVQPLAKYTLITNIAFSHSQIKKLKETIAKGMDPKPLERIEILDAGSLAAFLNSYPHLRSAFFVTSDFLTWEKQNGKFSNRYMIHTEIIGREYEVNTLKQHIENEDVRCIVVSGPHTIGKSRLVTDATEDWKNKTVFALAPESLNFKALDQLTNSKQETICIVEDPPLEKITDLSKFAYQIENLKIIITLPVKDERSQYNYGLDERTQFIEVKRLNRDQSLKLLHETHRPIPEHVKEWIVEKAGGNPGILLLAAAQMEYLIEEQTGFLQKIGEGFEQDTRRRLGEDAVEVLKRLSLLTHVGVSNQHKDEIENICETFPGYDLNKVLNQCDDLIRAGLIQKKGDFVQVTIPLLANHLAGKHLWGNYEKLLLLISRFQPSTSFRLFARICEIDNEETRQLLDELFDSFFTKPENVFNYAQILEYLAGTVPERVLYVLETLIKDSTYEYRYNEIAGEKRRNVMWILEQLLFRKATSEGALRLLGLLAEAENESYGNNATGMFESSFHYCHPQLPISYFKRLNLLGEFLKSHSDGLTIIVVHSITKSFNPTQCWMQTECKGLYPFDPSFKAKFYKEVFDYAEKLLKKLWTIADSSLSCKCEVLNQMPNFLSDITMIPSELCNISLDNFEKLVNKAKTCKIAFNVHNLYSEMEMTLDNFIRHKGENEFHDKNIPKLKKLIKEYCGASFEIRLKRILGGWGFVDNEKEDKKELLELANMVVKDQSILLESIFEWLINSAAPRNLQFFFALGKQDVDLVLWDKLLSKLNNKQCAFLFSDYFRGIASTNFELANRNWEKRIDQHHIHPIIWTETLMRLEPSDERIKKFESKLESSELDIQLTVNIMDYSYFTNQLTVKQLYNILQSICGFKYENAISCLHVLHSRLHKCKKLDESLFDIGWVCLENLSSVEGLSNLHDIDTVVAYLAEQEPERGFEIFKNAYIKFEKSKEAYYNNKAKNIAWKPIDTYSHHNFADTLLTSDPDRFLRMFLELTNITKISDYYISHLMKKYLNLSKYFNVILKLAKESKENARIISNWITSKDEKFHEFINEILPIYPNDEEIKRNFAYGIEQISLGHWGSHSDFLNSLLPEIDKHIEDENTHIVTREWLADVRKSLMKRMSNHIVWDYNEDIESLRRYIDDKNSNLRYWAIGRILKKGTIKDIQELLTIEEIEEALERIELPEERREILEHALRVWQNAF